MRRSPDQQTTSERDALGQYLDYQRETILLKTEGLTREQLGEKIPTSELTLVQTPGAETLNCQGREGLARHLAHRGPGPGPGTISMTGLQPYLMSSDMYE